MSCETSQLDLIKSLILNTKQPVILKNLKIPWKCFDQNFPQWCKELDELLRTEKQSEFETGYRKHGNEPQWEKYRSKIKMNAMSLCQATESEKVFFQTNWISMGYKNLKELPEHCINGIDFGFLGFPNVEDSTFWLSSEDSHTPCHYDTYGCNIVVQVYGRKLWLLFPPETTLSPTRIPYEESSVYCKEVFYSPKDTNQFHEIDIECYKYILEPGEILIVPRNWWHYVENLTSALSINTWIPLKCDIEAQIEECIVRCLISKFIPQTDPVEKFHLLNPNEILLEDESFFVSILQHLSEKMIKYNPDSDQYYNYQYLSLNELETVIENLQKFKIIQFSPEKLNGKNFIDMLKKNTKRFDSKIVCQKPINILKENLINSICNPLIIKQIKDCFLVEQGKCNKNKI